MVDQVKANFVQKKLKKDFYKNSGQHGWIVGTTGSGKTDFMIEVLRNLKETVPKETIIWRDYGKESEMLAILQFHDIKLFHPAGTTIKISKMNKKQQNLLNHEVKFYEFKDAKDILNNLDKKGVNAIAERRFIKTPALFISFWSTFFQEFINMALNYELPRPLSFFIDEMNNITPADGHYFAPNQSQLIQLLVYNAQNLRALEARLIPSTQGLASLNKGIRLQMQYYFFKRCNENIDIDIRRFKLAQVPVQRLRTNQVIIAGPSREYSDPIDNIPRRLPPKSLLPNMIYEGEYMPPVIESFKTQSEKQELKEELSDFKKNAAINLRKSDMPYHKIADNLGISSQTAYEYCNPKDKK